MSITCKLFEFHPRWNWFDKISSIQFLALLVYYFTQSRRLLCVLMCQCPQTYVQNFDKIHIFCLTKLSRYCCKHIFVNEIDERRVKWCCTSLYLLFTDFNDYCLPIIRDICYNQYYLCSQRKKLYNPTFLSENVLFYIYEIQESNFWDPLMISTKQLRQYPICITPS